MSQEFKDGKPCFNPNCLNNGLKPCEECGRIAGRSNTFWEDYEPIIAGLHRIVSNETNPDNLKLLSIALDELLRKVDTIFYYYYVGASRP